MLGLPDSVRGCLFDLDGVLTQPRADGTRSFLASRGIELPEGHDDDPPDALTVRGLGNRKNETFTRRVREEFEDALAGVAAGRAGLFGLVVGVDRVGSAEALKEHGADIVVADLAELMEEQ